VLATERETLPARLGLAIAKKRARKATTRSRLKRIARESFRHRRTALRGLDIVVMNKDPAAKAAPADLRQSLDVLYQQLISRRGGPSV